MQGLKLIVEPSICLTLGGLVFLVHSPLPSHPPPTTHHPPQKKEEEEEKEEEGWEGAWGVYFAKMDVSSVFPCTLFSALCPEKIYNINFKKISHVCLNVTIKSRERKTKKKTPPPPPQKKKKKAF